MTSGLTKFVNRAKLMMLKSEFLEWVKRIYKHSIWP
jgi:hypothetical protein